MYINTYQNNDFTESIFYDRLFLLSNDLQFNLISTVEININIKERKTI